MTRNPRPTGRDLARMDDRSFERWIRAQFRPSWRERLADFWSVSEDEPGIGGMLIAFAVFVLCLIAVFAYVLVMVP